MKGYKHLTPGQQAQILAAYQRTPSVTIVAKEVGVSVHQVRHLLHREGVPLSGSREGACYRYADLVRCLASEGTSLSEIARQIGTKHQSVAKFLRKHQIPYTPFRQTGANNPAWRGGRVTDQDGYILIHRPDHPHANRHGYVREHRLVMEQELGRPLLPTEVVDHIDGQRANNDPSNLRVFASNREHLATTLKDRTPQWSPEGKDRLRAAFVQGLGRRNAASRQGSGNGGAP